MQKLHVCIGTYLHDLKTKYKYLLCISRSYSLQMNQVLEHVIDYGISEKENLPVFFYHAVGLQTMRLQEDQQTIRMQEYEIPKEKMDELYAITNKVFIRDFDSFSGKLTFE